MPRPALPLARRVSGRLTTGLLALVLAAGALVAADGANGTGRDVRPVAASAKKKANVVTPGDFTGYGFDQCQAPSQAKMDRWLQSSPFLAVGIYIAGDSRACRRQTYLDATWVQTQLANGWRLLPITLGPQASCQPRFPRYKDDFKISPKLTNGTYATALQQGRTQASKSVAAAQALGIAPRSTLWYDLEGFSGSVACRDSALSFLSGWTQQIHALGYVSGVYSSAGSGLLALDDARVKRPTAFVMPDQIWIARWDGVANTSTSYLRSDGWMPHRRIKQYQGGHNETWGGVTINIDRNFLDVGRGSVAAPETYCGGVRLDYAAYFSIKAGSVGSKRVARIKVLQCVLTRLGYYKGPLSSRYNLRTQRAVQRFQADHALKVTTTWGRRNWIAALSAGVTPVTKYGSAGSAVRRLQRTLNAVPRAATAQPLVVTGVFDAATTIALKTWQKKVGVEVSGVAGTETWAALQSGRG